MNVVTLIGNLATDVDLRKLEGDKQVASFLLAIDRPGRDEADFIRIAVWDKQAEVCARYLVKGKRVGLGGRRPQARSSWSSTTDCSGRTIRGRSTCECGAGSRPCSTPT